MSDPEMGRMAKRAAKRAEKRKRRERRKEMQIASIFDAQAWGWAIYSCFLVGVGVWVFTTALRDGNWWSFGIGLFDTALGGFGIWRVKQIVDDNYIKVVRIVILETQIKTRMDTLQMFMNAGD